MFTSLDKGQEKNLMSGSNQKVFDPVHLQDVSQTNGLAAFVNSEYSFGPDHMSGANYWRATEILNQAREKVPFKDDLVVVGMSSSTYYLEGNPQFVAALKEAGELLKSGGIPAPIKLDRTGRPDDPDHNITLIADYYPETHGIILRDNMGDLASTVNTEDYPRISKAFYDARNENNKIVVVAEIRSNPGKQMLDNESLEGMLHKLDMGGVSYNMLFHADAMLTTFSLSATQSKELFEFAAARAVESASYTRRSETPRYSAENSAAAFELAVTALKAVENSNEVSDLISNAYEVGGKIVGLLSQANVTDAAHAVVELMERIPKLA